jgi:hypothetical protein
VSEQPRRVEVRTSAGLWIEAATMPGVDQVSDPPVMWVRTEAFPEGVPWPVAYVREIEEPE